MKSRVNPAIVENSKLTAYPYEVQIRTYDITKRKIINSWCIPNVIDATYITRIIKGHGIIGEDRILPRFLGLKIVPCNDE